MSDHVWKDESESIRETSFWVVLYRIRHSISCPLYSRIVSNCLSYGYIWKIHFAYLCLMKCTSVMFAWVRQGSVLDCLGLRCHEANHDSNAGTTVSCLTRSIVDSLSIQSTNHKNDDGWFSNHVLPLSAVLFARIFMAMQPGNQPGCFQRKALGATRVDSTKTIDILAPPSAASTFSYCLTILPYLYCVRRR